MLTVTIAIPAFNEEDNISSILRDLLNQKTEGFSIKKILVVSDGSTDRTVSFVKKIKSSKIDLIQDSTRQGLAFRQNQIFSSATSDVVVLIQADTRIKDRLFIQKLVSPIKDKLVDLTSAQLQELPTDSWVSEGLAWSMKLKISIYRFIKNGNSVYTCYGPARAFSKKLYSKIKFKHSVGEDAYSYFYCISKKMKFMAVSNAIIFYKLPRKLTEHISQSLRFVSSKELLKKEFSQALIKSEYSLPKKTVAILLLKFVLSSPISFIKYSAVSF